MLGTRHGGDLLRWRCLTLPLYKGIFSLVDYKYSGPVMKLSVSNQESISGLFEPLGH